MDESDLLPPDAASASDTANPEADGALEPLRPAEEVVPSSRPPEPTPDEPAPEGGAVMAGPAEDSTPAADAAAIEHAGAAAESERRAQENARRLEHEIASLRAGHFAAGHRDYRAFFEHERRIHTLFKELSPLPAGERHRLWSVLGQTGAEARRAQQDEWESRRYQSIEARETVEEKLRNAGDLAQGTQGAADYRRAEALLNEVRALLGSRSAESPGQLLIGPDRRACWDLWRQVRDTLKTGRDRHQEQDYQALAVPVAEVAEVARTGDPYEAIQRVKELQGRLGQTYLRRGQFEDLRKRLSEAWQAAQARITRQRQERSQHREEWRTRMEGHLERWRGTLEQKKGQHEHLLQQAAKLADMEQNARSEDFAVQVRGWSKQTAEKLLRTEESIAELEERILTTSRRLGARGAGGRAARARPAPPAPPAAAEEEAPHGDPPVEPSDPTGDGSQSHP